MKQRNLIAAIAFTLSILFLTFCTASCAGGGEFETHFLSKTNGLTLMSIELNKLEGKYQRGVTATTVTFGDSYASFQDIYGDTEGNSDTVSTGSYSYSATDSTLTVDGKTYHYTIEGDKITFEPDFYGYSTWDWDTY